MQKWNVKIKFLTYKCELNNHVIHLTLSLVYNQRERVYNFIYQNSRQVLNFYLHNTVLLISRKIICKIYVFTTQIGIQFYLPKFKAVFVIFTSITQFLKLAEKSYVRHRGCLLHVWSKFVHLLLDKYCVYPYIHVHAFRSSYTHTTFSLHTCTCRFGLWCLTPLSTIFQLYRTCMCT